MSYKVFIPLLSTLLFCTACPDSQYESDVKKLQKNNMDFPDLERNYYKGINYMLSDMFGYDYYDDYVLTEDAQTNAVHGLDVNFSVELFSKADAKEIQYSFEEEIGLLDAVHDNYIIKRKESLYTFSSSIKKELPSSVGFDGYIQVIDGQTYSYGSESSYFTATLEIDGDYFVFQLIGKKENMGFLYDDFIDILNSVEK